MSKPETPAEVDYRLRTEARAKQLAEQIQKSLPPGIGFSLFLFTFGEHDEPAQHLAYISSGKREDMIATVKEWLARMERGT